jgi:hypothetical protein
VINWDQCGVSVRVDCVWYAVLSFHDPVVVVMLIMCASGEMEKFLDWIVTEESFGTALFILRAKGQVKRDTVKRPGVIEHIPKKYKEYLESKGEEVPERYSDGTRIFVLGVGLCVLCHNNAVSVGFVCVFVCAHGFSCILTHGHM